jgi:hypothetical protein
MLSGDCEDFSSQPQIFFLAMLKAFYGFPGWCWQPIFFHNVIHERRMRS